MPDTAAVPCLVPLCPCAPSHVSPLCTICLMWREGLGVLATGGAMKTGGKCRVNRRDKLVTSQPASESWRAEQRPAGAFQR